jgi:hypothetical protein
LELVYSDGSTPNVRRPHAQPFRLPQGVDVRIPFKVVRSNGAPQNIAGWSLFFAMKEDGDDTAEVIGPRAAIITNVVLGEGYFPIGVADTVTAVSPVILPASGPYLGDVRAELPGPEAAELLPPTSIQLGPLVNEPGATPTPPPLSAGLIVTGAIQVRVRGNANVALTGLQTINGVALVAGDSVLLVGQTNPIQNGVWFVSATAWARPGVFDSGLHAAGVLVVAQQGIAEADTIWLCSTDAPTDVIDTNPLAFVVSAGGGGGGVQPARIRQTISMPYTSNLLGVDLTFVYAIYIPSDVLQVRIRLANRDNALGVHGPAVPGVDVAVGTSDGAFGYVGAPTVYSGRTLPADGIDDVLPWTPVTRGADGKILVAYSIPSGSTIMATGVGVSFGRRFIGATSVDPLPGPLGPNNSLALAFNLEFDTVTPRVVVAAGDSLVAGFDTGLVVQLDDSAFYRLGPDHGYAVDPPGLVGSTLAQWLDDARPWYRDDQRAAGADAIVEAGINDLPSQTIGNYQSQLMRKVRELRALGVARVFVTTMTPSLAYVANDAVRVVCNNWIRSIPLGIDGVIDLDAALRDPGSPSELLPAYRVADQTHWSVAGHTAALAIIAAALSA